MLSIDAVDVVEDRRKFASCSSEKNCVTRASSARWAVSMAVKYPDARVGDYPFPDGTVCNGRPPVLLGLRENIVARSAIFSRKCGKY
jgi:hypothetical protein